MKIPNSTTLMKPPNTCKQSVTTQTCLLSLFENPILTSPSPPILTHQKKKKKIHHKNLHLSFTSISWQNSHSPFAFTYGPHLLSPNFTSNTHSPLTNVFSHAMSFFLYCFSNLPFYFTLFISSLPLMMNCLYHQNLYFIWPISFKPIHVLKCFSFT